MLLNDIIKNVDLKSKSSTTTKTFINVELFLIYIYENYTNKEYISQFNGLISIDKLKYKIASIFNMIKTNYYANYSYSYHFKNNEFLSKNESLFNEFIQNHLNTENSNYKQIIQYAVKPKTVETIVETIVETPVETPVVTKQNVKQKC